MSKHETVENGVDVGITIGGPEKPKKQQALEELLVKLKKGYYPMNAGYKWLRKNEKGCDWFDDDMPEGAIVAKGETVDETLTMDVPDSKGAMVKKLIHPPGSSKLLAGTYVSLPKKEAIFLVNKGKCELATDWD